jgi:hypothetical protein
MAIGFRRKTRREVRAELAKMSDHRLIEHGKSLREFAKPTPGRESSEGWEMQLEEARAEWRRRHPPKNGNNKPVCVRDYERHLLGHESVERIVRPVR